MTTTKAMTPTRKEEKALLRNPWALWDELRTEMEGMWNRPWMPLRFLKHDQPLMPAFDVFRQDQELIVKTDLPGMNKEDIQVTLENGDLVLQGERKQETKVEEGDLLRCERTFGSFYRRLPLPFEVKANEIHAQFQDGVLEVRLPMPPETTAAVEKVVIN